eukprot:m.59957 g.59957  ORF g.59957 m.59957 type:complete len:750 (-) comp13831_c0_seq1:391-2640(-)
MLRTVLCCLLATALAFKPITLTNILDALSKDGLQQYNNLSPLQQQSCVAELNALSIGLADARSVRFSTSGKIYIVDDGPDAATLEAIHQRRGNRDRRAISDLEATEFDSQGIPQLSSKPGASNILYLDFNGHTTPDTSEWGVFQAKAFSLNNRFKHFNSAEKAFIENVWRRVTEDFAPFQYDVTTIEPETFNNTITRCLITSSTQKNGSPMPAADAGGVAYVNAFGDDEYVSRYSPALVYYDNLGFEEDLVAEAASHEVGHNLGLSHDGRDFPGTFNDEEYYQGERVPSNPISWGPIMGTGYRNSISQWSKGEYPAASNTQDDMAIMTAKLGTETDEAGDTIATALVLSLSDNRVNFSGIISTQDDVDVFRINVPSAGTLSIDATPWFSEVNTKGNNLDIELLVFNSAGELIGSSSPATVATASVIVNVVAGANYIRLDGVAGGIYTDYGSIGQYDLTAFFDAGNFVTTTEPTTAPTTTAPNCVDDLESNDSVGTATVVSNLPYTNNLGLCQDDSDYFAVNVCAGGVVEVSLSFVHNSGDIDMEAIANGEVIASSTSTDNIEALAIQNSGAITGTVHFRVYGYQGVSNPTYQINIQQTTECGVTTTPPTPAPCSCSGNWRSSSARTKNYFMRFRATCSQGHRFRFCLRRTDSRSGGTITAKFQRRSDGKYRLFQAKQEVGPNEGDRLCYAVDLPSSMTQRNERYRLRVSNSQRRSYRIRLGKTQVRSGDCDPVEEATQASAALVSVPTK